MDYHFNFGLIWHHFDKLSYGMLLSIELAVVSIGIGSFIGLSLAVLYTSSGRYAQTLISGYVEFVRNVPLILLVYLVFYGLPPLIGVYWSPTASFIITLSLYAGAYLVEVFRAGLAAIPHGLDDAARSIGLTPFQSLIYVRFPTMLRIVLPSLGNSFIALFKDTSIASVIAVPELNYGAHWMTANVFRALEAYIVITPMYLAAVYAILIILRQLEKKFAIVGQ